MFSRAVLLILIALIFFITNLYIGCRLYPCVHAVFPGVSVLWFGILCAVLAALAFLSVARSHTHLSPSVKYALGGYGGIRRGSFDKAIEGADEKLPLIVLDHTPSHIGEYPNSVDLILCGHTHRGQIFPRSLFTKRLFTVDYGLYRENDSSPTVIVTSGAGAWGMPMRVGSDSEIVSISLTGIK